MKTSVLEQGHSSRNRYPNYALRRTVAIGLTSILAGSSVFALETAGSDQVSVADQTATLVHTFEGQSIDDQAHIKATSKTNSAEAIDAQVHAIESETVAEHAAEITYIEGQAPNGIIQEGQTYNVGELPVK